MGVWVPVMLMFLNAGLAFGIRCDEGCDPSAPGWKNNPHAWEWSAQWWGLALPALVAATVTVAYLAGGRARRAGVAGAVTGALVLAWLILGQSIAASQVAGALLVVATVVWLGLRPRAA